MTSRFFFLPVCPISNKILILLELLKLEHVKMSILSQKRLEQITEQNNIMIPCLFINNKWIIGNEMIIIYLYNLYSNNSILNTWWNNQEIQNKDTWISNYLYHNVYKILLYDKIIKPFYNYNYDITIYHIKHAQQIHGESLEYFNKTLLEQDWIGGQNLSINDISCFGHLVALDYFGHIQWNKYIPLKQWFLRMKSQEQYNFILNYKLSLKSVDHYNLLDF